VRLASELTGWKIDLYSSREWLERGGEGPLFAPIATDDEPETRVPLAQLEGMSPELVAILDQAGFTTLNDVLDLDGEEIARIPGMTQGTAEEMLRFLAELTDEEPEAAEPAAAEPEGETPPAA
jgi:N utilization substance protein A